MTSVSLRRQDNSTRFKQKQRGEKSQNGGIWGSVSAPLLHRKPLRVRQSDLLRCNRCGRKLSSCKFACFFCNFSFRQRKVTKPFSLFQGLSEIPSQTKTPIRIGVILLTEYHANSIRLWRVMMIKWCRSRASMLMMLYLKISSIIPMKSLRRSNW